MRFDLAMILIDQHMFVFVEYGVKEVLIVDHGGHEKEEVSDVEGVVINFLRHVGQTLVEEGKYLDIDQGARWY